MSAQTRSPTLTSRNDGSGVTVHRKTPPLRMIVFLRESEVRQNRGRLYDPDTVDACIAALTDDGLKLEPEAGVGEGSADRREAESSRRHDKP